MISSVETVVSTSSSAVTGNASGSNNHRFPKRKSRINMTAETPQVDFDDPEGSLLELLSFLSEQPDLEARDSNDDILVVSWIWDQLQSQSNKSSKRTRSTPKFISPETTVQAYTAGLSSIRSLLQSCSQQLSPLDLHACISKQAMVQFCDSTPSSTTTNVCLVLCAYALRQRPSTLPRWKRWQSLIFETIALYQRYILTKPEPSDEYDDASSSHSVPSRDDVELWMNILLPACRHVQKAFATTDEVLSTPLLAGMVGTTSKLVSAYLEHQQTTKTLPFLKAIGPVIAYRYEKWVWCHPWRQGSTAASRRSNTPYHVEEESSRRLAFLKYKSDLSWWTNHPHDDMFHQDYVSGMDTAWSDVGIAHMSLTGFSFRPLVLSPSHVWNLWFPHVSVLLLDSETNSSGSSIATAAELLEAVLSTVEDGSKSFETSQKPLPSTPIGTMQLLMNRLMTVAQPKSQELPTVLGTAPTIMNNAKRVLDKYHSQSQVRIVQALVKGCPQPGLIPKLLDLLRPLVTSSPTEHTLWEYLATFWDEMMDEHVDEALLLQRVEPYVSVMTMVQLWIMVKQELPPLGKKREDDIIFVKRLFSFNSALQERLELWSTSSDDMAPTDYYRLFLLEGAISQVSSLIHSISKSATKSPPIAVPMGPAPPPVMGPALPPSM